MQTILDRAQIPFASRRAFLWFIALYAIAQTLLRVAVSDMAAFDGLYKRLTDAVPIKNVTSHFAMERMKFTTAYPVDTRNR